MANARPMYLRGRGTCQQTAPPNPASQDGSRCTRDAILVFQHFFDCEGNVRGKASAGAARMRYPVESSVGGVRGAGGSRRARLEWRSDEGFSRAFARDASVCCRGWSAALLVGFVVSWACAVGSFGPLFRSSSEEDRNRVESCPSGVCRSARAKARSRWQRVAFAACRLIEMEMIVAAVLPKK